MRFFLITCVLAISVSVLHAQENNTTSIDTNASSENSQPETPSISGSSTTPTSEPVASSSSNNSTSDTTQQIQGSVEPSVSGPDTPVNSNESSQNPQPPSQPETPSSSNNSTVPTSEPAAPGSSDNSTSQILDPNEPPVPVPTAPDNPDDSANNSSSNDRRYPFVIPLKEYQLNNFNDLQDAQRHLRIAVNDLEVPAGETLNFNLLKGTILTFKGRVTFGFKPWEGPLVRISGRNVKVYGKPGNLLDGDGKRWWDGKGGNGGIDKPKFLALRLKDSIVSGLHLKNSPVHGISINSCDGLTVSWINFDNKDGAYKLGGHNTDAFDVGNSNNIVISDSTVYNQDDCLAINSGTNIQFYKNYCSGGHGISIGSVGGRKSNVVANVVIRDSTVANSDNGIRVKTVSNTVGEVTNVKFENIRLVNIEKVGIRIQGNYLNGGPKGDPTPGVPIRKLTMWNIEGNVLPGGTNYLVWVANASDWWFKTNVQGGKEQKPCKGLPAGTQPVC